MPDLTPPRHIPTLPIAAVHLADTRDLALRSPIGAVLPNILSAHSIPRAACLAAAADLASQERRSAAVWTPRNACVIVVRTKEEHNAG